MSVLLTIANQVRRHSVRGVSPSQLHILEPALPRCHGLVLWQGERATVVECAYGRGGENVRVIRNVDALMVTAEPVPHPPPASPRQSSAAR